MDSSSIQLKDSEIDKVQVIGDMVKIYFSKAFIIKTMTGSVEKTRWYQAGFLIFEQAELENEVTVPAICAGGDVNENVYTYRDMIPVPLESRGIAGCNLQLQGTDERIIVRARSVKLQMMDVPKYIEHIRPN